jgi:Head fiber protein.
MANTYNTKNYFAHGGEQLVIGGKLTFLEGAEVENFPGGNTNSTEAPYVADSEATTVAALKSDFNSLLAVLRTAGILSATAPETAEPPAGGEGGGS